MTLVRLEEVSKVFSQSSPRSVDMRWLREAWKRGPAPEEALAEDEDAEFIVALDRVNLVVRSGEIMGVIGPSGCGKSTLLRVVAGLLRPDRGRVLFDGEDVTRIPPHERSIGMVFQTYALYPHMTAWGNLAFYFIVQKRRQEIPERVRAVSEVMGVGFDALLGRMPRGLSAGERQRVALGRCISRRPRLFLFDEPLSNLDAKLRVRTRTEIKRLLQRFRVTTLYVTHDQTEALALADRLAVMREGRIEQVGTYLEIYHWPVNQFVAGFVGTPAMNFCRGHFTSEQEFDFGFFTLPLGRMSRLRTRRFWPGQPVVLGVRPEHLWVETGEGLWPATVEMVQPLLPQHEQIVHLRGPRGSEWVVCAPSPPAIRRGERVWLDFDPAEAHLFDANGERIP